MPGASGGRRGPRAIPVELPKQGEITVYAGARIGDALEGLQEDMNLYQGVKLGQVLEALYDEGLQNGRAQVFTELDQIRESPALRHRRPGRPRKQIKGAKKAAVKKAAKKTPTKKA